MSSALPRLGAANTQRIASPRSAGVLHLGLGSFHRAHQAVYTAAALRTGDDDWGIVGVASRSRSVVDAMRAQDLLYTVAEISPRGTALRVPGAHTDVFVAAEEPARVAESLADPAIRVVTLTVTENGYSYSPVTGHLDLADAGIVADLSGSHPQTPIGQLARGVQLRAGRSGAPLTILSCDNLSENGAHTERLVREFLSALPGTEGDEALAYLDQAVAFPSSMVDRIVPATTAQLREATAAQQGLWDEVPVPAEPFSMWAIEDRFAAGRPSWEAGGAVFTDEVGRYEQMKVRLLNGTHSLIAYLGALRGASLIAESIEMPNIEESARLILRREFEPFVEAPTGIDLRQYESQLFDRWANSALGHRTAQVGTDGSVKLGQRIPGPALLSLDRGEVPHMIALTVAAYLSCIAPISGFDPGPHARAMIDPAREKLAGIAASARNGVEIASRVISDLKLFGQELAEKPVFVARVGELIDTIVRHGVDAAIGDCTAATQKSSTITREAHR
ncbi:mannitol dehydrogenase family protein [Agreia bicolorata]|uniref:Mannitol-1-phosphate 5-dehydrogenase n=1 Tax=Agreia bicolorata TaxID=110935 RepID=A0ABR5CBE5_9MICO|nr:mannitol dehydrogenase family protein [Agreia bicolorata]KJC62958.1 fructuronate reductase [Agreia bicolorata]